MARLGKLTCIEGAEEILPIFFLHINRTSGLVKTPVFLALGALPSGTESQLWKQDKLVDFPRLLFHVEMKDDVIWRSGFLTFHSEDPSVGEIAAVWCLHVLSSLGRVSECLSAGGVEVTDCNMPGFNLCLNQSFHSESVEVRVRVMVLHAYSTKGCTPLTMIAQSLNELVTLDTPLHRYHFPHTAPHHVAGSNARFHIKGAGPGWGWSLHAAAPRDDVSRLIDWECRESALWRGFSGSHWGCGGRY